MNDEQLDILLTDEVAEQIENHLDDDPQRVALQLGRHGSLIATQIKYLQRARQKLPSYYAARCILSPIAFEQASSELSAAEKHYRGDLCIDLTCGLGVDAYHFSHTFRRVVAVESDPVRARMAALNFRRLGANNVEVVVARAEQFIETFEGHADLIYVDPARRDGDDRKVSALEDCSPNVATLMPRLRQVATTVVVKLSPLYDVQEVFRRFGATAAVSVISLHGECKEVLVELLADRAKGVLRVVMATEGILEFDPEQECAAANGYDPPYGYLLVPDVSLCKVRRVGCYAQQIGAYALSDRGYCLCATPPDHPFGRLYTIEQVWPYHPKSLKKELRQRGMDRCNLMRNDFPLGVEVVARALGIGQGGSRFAALCRIDGSLSLVLLGQRIV